MYSSVFQLYLTMFKKLSIIPVIIAKLYWSPTMSGLSTVSGKIMLPQRCPQPQPQNPWLCYTHYMAKGMLQLSIKECEVENLSWIIQVNPRFLQAEKGGEVVCARATQCEKDSMGHCSFWRKKGATSQGMQEASKSWGNREQSVS